MTKNNSDNDHHRTNNSMGQRDSQPSHIAAHLNMTIVPSGLKAGKLRWLSICTRLGSSPNTDPEMECVCVGGVSQNRGQVIAHVRRFPGKMTRYRWRFEKVGSRARHLFNIVRADAHCVEDEDDQSSPIVDWLTRVRVIGFVVFVS